MQLSACLVSSVSPVPRSPRSKRLGLDVWGTYHERLAERELREEDVLLEHIADLPLEVFVERVAVEEDIARVRPQTPGQHVQQCCLPGAW